jgi:ATP-dependent RNA helicase SUPV3L1/SUV3
MLGTALAALGFRLLDPAPLEEGQYGPPTPLRVAQPRPFQGPRREGRGAPPQQRQGARPDRGRPQQQRPAQPPEQRPRNGAAEFYGPPVPPELRAAMRPPRPEGEGQQRHREGRGGGGGGGKPRHAAGKPWQGGQRGAGPRNAGDGRPDRPPRGGPPPKPPEKRINPDSPFAILANLKLR